MKMGRGLIIAFGAYAFAAAVLFGHRDLLAGTHYLSDGGQDASLYIWMFRFLPEAILHFQNPFVLKEAWAPFGLNITQATTTPILALLAWPITALIGPVVSYNIVAMAAPALAATACFAFARSYAKTWITAFGAGWIFGFSSTVFAPMLGHLQTSIIAFLPLAFLAVRQRAIGSISIVQFSITLLLVLIGQFLVSLEDFVTETIFLFLFTVVTEATMPGGIKRLARLRTDNLVVGLIAVYAAVGLAMSPFIYSFFRDYGEMPHVLQNGGNSVIDLLNFVIPTPITWLGGDLAYPFSRPFATNWSEGTGYIGVPLALLTLLCAWRLRHEKQVWPLLAVLVCGFVFALGPWLHIHGRPVMQLPWGAVEKLPFLANALPSRLMPYVLLGISGICAFSIDNHIQSRRRIGLAALCVAAICVLPATFTRPGTWNALLPTAQFISSGAYRNVIRQGETVLFLPFSFGATDAMFWQTEASGYFRMANGYGNFVPLGLDSWPGARMLESGAPGLDFPRQFNLFMRANGIDKLVVPVSIQPVWNSALERSSWYPQRIDDFSVFTQSSHAQNATPKISSAEARYDFESGHFAALQAAATCMLGKGAGLLNIESANAAHCLSADIAPVAADPYGNWDRIGGWLGFYGKNIGLGVTTDAVTAAKIVAKTAAGAAFVYFPYPRQFKPGVHPDKGSGQTGQLLEVFPPATVAAMK